jgi:alpha-L-rhamnosidase
MDDRRLEFFDSKVIQNLFISVPGHNRTKIFSKRYLIYGLFCISTLLVFPGTLLAASGDSLEASFLNPPETAKPQTWWHWVDGNVSKDGITADLEAMKRVGISKAYICNVGQGFPTGPASFMSQQWLDDYKFAADEAERLGMKLGFHNSPGWSSSGGPWVKPEYAMQTVVTSEIHPQGGKRFVGLLPLPPIKDGFYRDIAVLAFPTCSNDVRIDDLDDKGLFSPHYKFGELPESTTIPADALIQKASIMDLTSKVTLEGKLIWDVPPGNWTILRVGHTPTGQQNQSTPDVGRGLECDKLSRAALDKYWADGIEPILKNVGPMAGKVLNGCFIDSYEVGDNNWTDGFREEFIKRRGYNPIPFLPVLSGRYVESGEVTERFLWDFRRTIGDLFAENYHGYFCELCKKHGLLSSIEPYDGPFEELLDGAKPDIVMGEFWVNYRGMDQSVKLAASTAHTHGKSLVGSEAFTAAQEGWLAYPGSLKALGDWAFCTGINLFNFHTYTHQPWINKVPGMTFHWYGTHFDRNNTWWEQSRAWMSYLAKCQFLLQQGRSSADVLFFAGESAPNNGAYLPDLKKLGYDYDAIGSDLILKLAVKDNFICTPTGEKYRILVLPDTTWMTPALVEKIGELVSAGATVIGPKPAKSPSLANYPDCDSDVADLAGKIWGPNNDARSFGEGRIIPAEPVTQALSEMKVSPDFEPVHGENGLDFIHRIVGATDLYFISNQQTNSQTADCAFRVTGREPEIWNPETGGISRVTVWHQENGRTIVTLNLEQSGALFVVFRKPIPADADPVVQVDYSFSGATNNVSVPKPQLSFDGDQLMIASPQTVDVVCTTESGIKKTAKIESVPDAIEMTGPWDVTFPEGLGAPPDAIFDKLVSWPDRSEDGIKYFSGTATYRKEFTLPVRSLRPDYLIELDLGQVDVIAEVYLNGEDLGILWKAPFRVKLGKAAKAGKNELEVRVTNLWPNRLIGDARFPEDSEWNDWTLKTWPDWVWATSGLSRPSTNRVTFTTWHHWGKDSPLQPSGLLGPVFVRTYLTRTLQ